MAIDPDHDEDDGRIIRQRALGAELRQVFGRLADEQVPDSLMQLAARLEEQLAAAEDGRQDFDGRQEFASGETDPGAKPD